MSSDNFPPGVYDPADDIREPCDFCFDVRKRLAAKDAEIARLNNVIENYKIQSRDRGVLIEEARTRAERAEAERDRLAAALKPFARVRPSVLAFALLMERKLAAKDDENPRGWLECEPDYLLGRLSSELDELREALGRRDPVHAEVRSEAVDVGNFAMMLADQHYDAAVNRVAHLAAAALAPPAEAAGGGS